MVAIENARAGTLISTRFESYAVLSVCYFARDFVKFQFDIKILKITRIKFSLVNNRGFSRPFASPTDNDF